MAGFWDSLSSGSGGTFGNILGGLGTAATIYQAYNQNQQAEDTADFNQQITADKFAEDRRQFDLNYQLAQAKLAQGGGGGGGGGGKAALAAVKAQVQAAHSKAISGAYDSMIQAVESGRAGEASTLVGILDRIQKAYGQASYGRQG